MRRGLTVVALSWFATVQPLSSCQPRWKSCTPAEELQRRVGQLVGKGDVEQVARELRAGLEKSVFSMKAFASALFLCEQTHNETMGIELVRQVQASQLVPAWTDESVLAVILRLQCAVGDAAAAIQMFSFMASARFLRLRSASVFLAFCCQRGDRRMAFAVYEEALRHGIELRAADYISLGRLCVAVGEPVSTLHFMLREMQEHVMGVPHTMVREVLRPWAAAAAAAVGGTGLCVTEVCLPRDSAGTCPCCGDALRGHRFTTAQKTRLLHDVIEVAMMPRRGKSDNNNITRLRTAFEAWRRFVATHGSRIDVLIDGANLGYYGLSSWYEDAKRALLLQRGRRAESITAKDVAWSKHRSVDVTVNFHLIDLAVQEARRRGMRPLVILHERHCEARNITTDNAAVAAQWRRDGLLYCTPSGLNDDLCWLYAALELTTPTDAAAGTVEKTVWVLTNDMMRDHHFRLLSPRFFARWRDRHRIAFKCSREDNRTLLHWELPAPYARCIQELRPLTWHIPITEEDAEEEVVEASKQQQQQEQPKQGEDENAALTVLSQRWVCLR
ncbi:hypothetical protein DQ04_09501020 [Trypanosoma grayi]|uniref:hypothetical protein n=1 Tax=Trypanosoma grayi TaxID=71804 RepID=UPI0004F3F57C|nr:hypothetical protein DQ04_09501020 [Trypanosoma grayi]KEG07541.1 hypothetical protein DQ04_09501020 [Trypanosoma grayi]